MDINAKLKVTIITGIMCLYGLPFKNQLLSDQQVNNTQENIVAAMLEEQDTAIWSRLRNNFSLNLAKENSYVQFHAAKYKRQEYQYLQKINDNATTYISHIVEQLEKRNMPGELALLPMIESSFNPHAKSNVGATGIWQLLATTGKRYGLTQSKWYDGRKDVAAATNAALSYLQFLHGEFNGDWFLALAAYNAGEGCVKRAIKRNLAANKPTDFWSLNLPKQTKNFVPKLLALAGLVKHADLNDMLTLRRKHMRYFAMVNNKNTKS